MTDTPLDRLNRMLANAPHGPNAARLLQNLVVFQDSFGRAAPTFMTPEDMSERESIKAFATLRNWCLVQQVTRRRYQIDDSLKQHFPPTPDLFARHFDYFSSFGGARDSAWVYFYWRDFALALLWGMRHSPIEVQGLGRKLRPMLPRIDQAWLVYLETIRRLALRVYSDSEPFVSSRRENNPSTEAPLTPDEWVEQSLALYFEINGHSDQAILFALRGLTAHQNEDLISARYYYNQALALYDGLGIRIKQIEISRTLFEIALEQENLGIAQADLARYMGLVTAGQQARSLYLLGQLAHKVKNAPVARDAFARALSLINPRNAEMMNRILADWSLMEYELGDRAEAYALYHQAMSAYRQGVEMTLGFDAGTWQKGQLAKLQALATMMGSHDV